MSGASTAYPLRAVDERQRERERAESMRLLARAEAVKVRAELVAARVRRMNALYRERLVGNREPEGGE